MDWWQIRSARSDVKVAAIDQLKISSIIRPDE